MIRFSNLVIPTTKSILKSGRGCGNRYFFSKFFSNVGDATENKPVTTPVTKEMTKELKYPVKQVYGVILKVEDYKEFLPFCLNSTILKRDKDKNYFEAELEVGQGGLKESYISKVVYKENELIESTATDTPLFHKLINTWNFKPGETPNTTIANCKLIYHFKSPFYATLMENFFSSSLDVMINSFDKRCDELYGHSSNSSKKK
ncbi:hypothetical protein RB653_010557 [Dictyostelium firmibasis]|uniref:Coenzyme Q-binding protein COQ10 START domain-containing protein n=1 Tax=Dictyostelium firmibasis TaxID=79012 RepID=A0AAN7YL60_9MYCE